MMYWITQSLKFMVIFTLLSALPAYAKNNIHQEQSSVIKIITPTDVIWGPGPSTLPTGAEMAVLEGNPAESGIFTIRLKFPANFKISPHWHPKTERLTVISGKLYLGMGNEFEANSAKELSAGSFATMAPETHHFAFTRRPTIIQLTGEGPWGVTFTHPKDDSPKNHL